MQGTLENRKPPTGRTARIEDLWIGSYCLILWYWVCEGSFFLSVTVLIVYMTVSEPRRN